MVLNSFDFQKGKNRGKIWNIGEFMREKLLKILISGSSHDPVESRKHPGLRTGGRQQVCRPR